MECPLCIIWARMPYAKRWSTPTTAYDTESALVIGFWLGIQYRTPETLCEKHALLISHLNRNPSLLSHNQLAEHIRQPQPTAGPRRVTNHTFVTLPDPLPPGAIYICSHIEKENGICGKSARYEATANFDTDGRISVVKRLLCAKHAIVLAANESQPEPMEFTLGLKPLANENTTTEPPPLPVSTPFPDFTQPNTEVNRGSQQIQNAMDYALQPKPVISSPAASISAQPTASPQPVDPRELARQAALMPPTMGRKMEEFIPEEPTPAEGDGSTDDNG